MLISFLLERNILSSGDLLDVIIEQMESFPNLLKVIKNEGVISEDHLLRLFIEAARERTSFAEFFKQQSGLTGDDLSELFNKQTMTGKSLGNLIVSKGLLSQEKWDSSVREYLASGEKEKFDSYIPEAKAVPAPQAEVKEEVKEETKTEAPVTMAGISAAALESLKQVQGLDTSELEKLEAQMAPAAEPTPKAEVQEEVVKEEIKAGPASADTPATNDDVLSDITGGLSIYAEEFFDKYSDDLQSEMLVVANRFRLKGREKDLVLLHQHIATVLSLIKLSEYSYIEKLVTPYEALMSRLINDNLEIPEQWNELISEMLEILWGFRTQLFNKKTEVDILKDENFKVHYIENIKKIMTCLKR